MNVIRRMTHVGWIKENNQQSVSISSSALSGPHLHILQFQLINGYPASLILGRNTRSSHEACDIYQRRIYLESLSEHLGMNSV